MRTGPGGIFGAMKGGNMKIIMQTDQEKSISNRSKEKMLANQAVSIQQQHHKQTNNTTTANFPSEDLENTQCFSAFITNNCRALKRNVLYLALLPEG